MEVFLRQHNKQVLEIIQLLVFAIVKIAFHNRMSQQLRTAARRVSDHPEINKEEP